MTWRKSTRSNNGTDCVEVRNDLTAVRDSKNPTGPALPVDLRSLVRHLKG
ncbi:DUF397 domain-containing protein [Actinokineospora cianjurensis]|uniref:Uncharacterized protein DUF397 n=1 Tax=Actinokineospora cianjurensis TaxID=585224 RepID=A0A421B8R5_9PSEU|nr:DUF397 domain-containing protein [Actinokineospora cianjurensis]RLK60777.1 uncharacterized protein DUF397 [Actinokineospora cianjurensis]